MPRLTEAQRAFRRVHLNASEFAAVCGLSPFRGDDACAAWNEKLGLVVDDDAGDDDAFWFGHELEPIVARRFSEKSGHALIPGGSFEHPSEPWCAATIDHRLVGERANLEIKIVGGHMAYLWRPGEPDGVSHACMVQAQIQMAVTDVPRTYVAALIGGTQFTVFVVDAQPDLQAHLLGQGREFWRMVQTREPPPITGSDSTRARLQAQWPRESLPVRMSTSEEDSIAYSRHLAATREKESEQEKKRCDHMLLDRVREHGGIVGDGWKLTWRLNKAGARAPRFTWKGDGSDGDA